MTIGGDGADTRFRVISLTNIVRTDGTITVTDTVSDRDGQTPQQH